ncbi:linear amide C-N hydrolase [Shewanella olleyana]|uniref:linear amide C-N hydrolase n=1 Tax=Shewanella olleyana TaxID=135626 RepID=UPI00200DD6E0|nr:linear amide C-N hydrolase [Shewanella olleyana]MCL1066047.1 linear amide C-N hydrolase [Shewanella olleyana]
MKIKTLAASIFSTTLLVSAAVDACTGIRLVADNGDVVAARTMEFSDEMIDWSWKIYPRGHEFQGYTPDGANGKTWQAKYGMVTTVALGDDSDIVTEGLNEHGLQTGVFFFLPYGPAKWSEYNAAESAESIAGWQIATYVLSQAKNVEEAVELLKNTNIVDAIVVPKADDWNFSPTVHFNINDADGNSVVIEYINGELKVHDNPLGTITNNPRFEWHQENLKRYTHLPQDQAPLQNSEKVKAGGLDVGGLQSLDGEPTAANRFVRAARFSQEMPRFDSAKEGVHAAISIMNTFEIPNGYKKYRHTDGKDYSQTVAWTVASDLENKVMYIKSYQSPEYVKVELDNIDFTTGKVSFFDIPTEFKAESVEIK